jgi:hypothetical protein
MANVVNEQLKRNSILFWYGLINFVLLFFCMGLYIFDDTLVMGKNAWQYPMKYYFSIGIFIWSMGWYLYFLNNSLQRKILSWAFLLTTSIQTSIVLLQSSRGVSSFYNQNTPFDKLVFGFQTANNVVFILIMVVTTYLFYFQKKNSKSQHFTWGIRMGMMIFLIGLLIGVYLMKLNSHAIGTNEKLLNQAILDKSKHGNFKIPFFLGIHGLQIIPLLSYYFFQNKKQVVNFTFLYFIMMVVFFFMAIINLKIF